MAYTDDSVKAKLSALNETQESIVTVAQWVMFHRRHADRTAQLWLERLRDSNPSKRLNLIYLANEVAQQSKARRKDDFLIAFSPIIADATATAYKGASNDIQVKLRRVVEVWRQRQIFELPIQEAVEARVEELDKSRSSGKKPLLGGSLFSSAPGSLPAELQPLAPLQTAVSKASVSSNSAVTTANTEYDKLHGPSVELPAPPVHAARLSQLLKSLANAESSVSDIIKSREALIGGLEKLLNSNREALAKEQSQVQELSTRKAAVEAKKREVEDGIMRGLSAEESTESNREDIADRTVLPLEEAEPERPAVEELTPPPVESLTPMGSPKLNPIDTPQNHPPLNDSEDLQPLSGDAVSSSTTAPDILSNLAMSHGRSHSGGPANGSSAKKRKVSHGQPDYSQFTGGDAMEDLDDDVAELLRQESNKR